MSAMAAGAAGATPQQHEEPLLTGLKYALTKAAQLEEELVRAIQRSSSATTTPVKGYSVSRSPFGRKRDGADEREALLAIRRGVEELCSRLEFASAEAVASPLGLERRLHRVEEARDDLLHLCLRKNDVVIRERTILEAVIGLVTTGRVDMLEDDEGGFESEEECLPVEEKASEEKARAVEMMADWGRREEESHRRSADANAAAMEMDMDLRLAEAEATHAHAHDGGVASTQVVAPLPRTTTLAWERRSEVEDAMDAMAMPPRRPVASTATAHMRRPAKRRLLGDLAAEKKMAKASAPAAATMESAGNAMEASGGGVGMGGGLGTGQKQKQGSPTSVLDFDAMLKIDSAIPPSTVCGFPPKDTPIQPSKLSGERQEAQEAAEATEVEGLEGAEAGAAKGVVGRRRAGPVALVRGLAKGIFSLALKGCLVVAAVSTVSTMPAAAKASKDLRQAARVCQMHAGRITNHIKASPLFDRSLRMAGRKKSRGSSGARRSADPTDLFGAASLPQMRVTERTLEFQEPNLMMAAGRG